MLGVGHERGAVAQESRRYAERIERRAGPAHGETEQEV